MYLVAAGEREGEAEWYFTATIAVALAGSHQLLLVVRTPAAAEVEMLVGLQAKVRRRLGGIIPYRADLADPGHRLLIPATTSP